MHEKVYVNHPVVHLLMESKFMFKCLFLKFPKTAQHPKRTVFPFHLHKMNIKCMSYTNPNVNFV